MPRISHIQRLTVLIGVFLFEKMDVNQMLSYHANALCRELQLIKFHDPNLTVRLI